MPLVDWAAAVVLLGMIAIAVAAIREHRRRSHALLKEIAEYRRLSWLARAQAAGHLRPWLAPGEAIARPSGEKVDPGGDR